MHKRLSRTIQRVTGFHKIHHIWYSYGYKIPLVKLAYFRQHGFKRLEKDKYHNCTITGIN
ncbi:hypothetical protein QD47_18530 [Paenibacillus terrae]|uniref:Uncharacterized protein n=1 Tax=Paenibacillus terrae TaxID=159743 RepID=A0A0D7X2C9_9BACL|nr:hypothetical protein QD47_18530 [Paenibacillus terrae]